MDVVAVDRIEGEHVDHLLELFGDAWWTAHRSRLDVERLLEGSDVVVGIVEARSGRLVGFARAVTDGTFLAVMLDVIVAPDHRGTGLGARVMDELLARPELARVESIELVCQPDLIPFYKRFGFTDAVGHSRLMRRTTNPALVDAPSA